MNMRYFWTVDLQNGNIINIKWLPGKDMIADYVTKHHSAPHTRVMRKYYLQTKETPDFLKLSVSNILRGCVKPGPKGTRNLHQNIRYTDRQTSKTP